LRQRNKLPPLKIYRTRVSIVNSFKFTDVVVDLLFHDNKFENAICIIRQTRGLEILLSLKSSKICSIAAGSLGK
jgi:hypothetical protein